MPTAADVDHFRTFGYVVLRDYVPEPELALLHEEFERAMAATHAEAERPFDGSERHFALLMGESTPYASSFLVDDPRFAPVAAELLGHEVVPYAVDANRWVTGTGWHPDAHPDTHGVKFVLFYREPVGVDSGCLRVIPGSHRRPLYDDVGRFLEARDDAPFVAAELRPGDVLAFDIPLWHSTFGGSRDRRQITVAYFEAPETVEQVAIVQDHFRRGYEAHETFLGAGYSWFDPYWLEQTARTAPGREQLARLERLGVLRTAGAPAGERA